MSSSAAGTTTSDCEVTNIISHGIWVLLHQKEYFIPFADYPRLKGAKVSELLNIQAISPGQLHWPELDEDIEIAALKSAGEFPLGFG